MTRDERGKRKDSKQTQQLSPSESAIEDWEPEKQ